MILPKDNRYSYEDLYTININLMKENTKLREEKEKLLLLLMDMQEITFRFMKKVLDDNK